jgi:3-deoxy-D-manno-octulosonic-acid transferase
LFRIAAPLVLIRLWWRGVREPAYRRWIGERFGFYRVERRARPLLWVHAVSVGEARASVALVKGLAVDHPGHDLLVTCMTAAGREALRELHGDSVSVAWLPYDYPGSVRRFLRHFRPLCGLLVETEIWPNLLEACRLAGIPVMLANARMSANSARAYARLPGLAGPAIASLSLVCAQSEADAARLRALGARRIEVTGNLKFDITPDQAKRSAGRTWRARLSRPVLLLASTREHEEVGLLRALPTQPEDLLTVLVPRHARRFDEVALLAARGGEAVPRRSMGREPQATDRCYLGDTMGEMDFYYGAADVAVIGGSFEDQGGQNLIEACAAGVPVVVGPSTFNFAEATRLALAAGAALQSPDTASAIRQAAALLADPSKRAAMGEEGRKFCESHRGATRRHLELCNEILRAPGRG